MKRSSLRRRPGRIRFPGDVRGAAAVEFAFIAPVLVVVVVGSYQLAEAVSAYRKTSVTARTVADLATQYASMGPSDVSAVLGASAQVMVPFDTTSIGIVLTEYQTNAAGASSVTWSKALNDTPLTAGATAVIPANICLPNSYIVFAKVTYKFQPALVYGLTGPITMTSQIYMTPRQTASVTYKDS